MQIPVVSIICITYNQEKYIDKAIDSFISQETDFPIEIIIHDDASNDNTCEKIKEWREKYPKIIRIIIEEENTFSKEPKDIFVRHTFPYARGEYIAICEGDDYWCDKHKLQKQYDFAQNNKACSLIVHSAYICNENGVLTNKIVRPYKESRVMPIGDVAINGASIVHTASMFFKSSDVTFFPSFYYVGLVSDFHLMLLLAAKGEIYYMDELMSVYRVNSVGSMVNEQAKSISGRIQSYKDGIKTIKMYRDYLKKDIPEFDYAILLREYYIAAYKGQFWSVIHCILEKWFWELPVRKRISLLKCAWQNRSNK